MFKKALGAMVALEGLSLLAFVWPALALPALVVIGAGTLLLALKRPEWGIYILFGELFVGSRGHLLEFGPVSLRLVVFAAVFLSWGMRGIREIRGIGEIREVPRAYWVLFIVIGFGVIRGVVAGNEISNVFYDANGYLYLLILPAVLAAVRNREILDNIFRILAAAILVIALKGLGLFVWFAFGLPGVAAAYHWIIGQKIGEITGHVGQSSRIFMQSQFWAVVGMFIFGLNGNLKVSATPDNNVADVFRPPLRFTILAAAVFSVVLSLSRSFWLGAVAGGIFLLIIWLWKRIGGIREIGVMGGRIMLLAAVSFGLLWGLGKLAGGTSEAVASRGLNPAAEAAGGARLLLLPELLEAIKTNPVFGAGFGKTVSYDSYLPDRIKPDNPAGRITTYAFEWGYLDTWLKIGLIGLIVYLLFIARIFRTLPFSLPRPGEGRGGVEPLGIYAGLVALLILNITTPYLNHPLGIGYLIFVYSYQFVIRKENEAIG